MYSWQLLMLKLILQIDFNLYNTNKYTTRVSGSWFWMGIINIQPLISGFDSLLKIRATQFVNKNVNIDLPKLCISFYFLRNHYIRQLGQNHWAVIFSYLFDIVNIHTIDYRIWLRTRSVKFVKKFSRPKLLSEIIIIIIIIKAPAKKYTSVIFVQKFSNLKAP